MITMPASSRLARLGSALLVALVVLAAAAPARSASEEEVEQARRAQQEAAAERAAALDDLNEAARIYEELNAQYQDLIFRIGQMRSRIDAYEAESRRLRAGIRERAVEAYMAGGQQGSLGGIVMSDRALQTLVARQVMARAVEEQAASLDSMEAITAEMVRLKAEMEEETLQAGDLRLEAEAVAARMYELLAERNAELAAADQNLSAAEAALAEQRRREEEERLARLAEEERLATIRAALLGPAGGVPDSVTPGFACPVPMGSTVFVDSWGAPRSGGRLHVGTDMMGPRGTPLYAVANGVIQHGSSVAGGTTLRLYADYGGFFLYAHLDAYNSDLSSGQWVARGTVIGYMGSTGNSAPGAYHLHFEIHPNGMGAVNPHPTLARHC
jgi:murein DD-endopeptidase MepM/ murein hydrolase activator NlpD